MSDFRIYSINRDVVYPPNANGVSREADIVESLIHAGHADLYIDQNDKIVVARITGVHVAGVSTRHEEHYAVFTSHTDESAAQMLTNLAVEVDEAFSSELFVRPCELSLTNDVDELPHIVPDAPREDIIPPSILFSLASLDNNESHNQSIDPRPSEEDQANTQNHRRSWKDDNDDQSSSRQSSENDQSSIRNYEQSWKNDNDDRSSSRRSSEEDQASTRNHERSWKDDNDNRSSSRRSSEEDQSSIRNHEQQWKDDKGSPTDDDIVSKIKRVASVVAAKDGKTWKGLQFGANNHQQALQMGRVAALEGATVVIGGNEPENYFDGAEIIIKYRKENPPGALNQKTRKRLKQADNIYNRTKIETALSNVKTKLNAVTATDNQDDFDGDGMPSSIFRVRALLAAATDTTGTWNQNGQRAKVSGNVDPLPVDSRPYAVNDLISTIKRERNDLPVEAVADFDKRVATEFADHYNELREELYDDAINDISEVIDEYSSVIQAVGDESSTAIQTQLLKKAQNQVEDTSTQRTTDDAEFSGIALTSGVDGMFVKNEWLSDNGTNWKVSLVKIVSFIFFTTIFLTVVVLIGVSIGSL